MRKGDIKAKGLPNGAMGYYSTRDEAIEHCGRGVLVEIKVTPHTSVFGVFVSQKSLCTHAAKCLQEAANPNVAFSLIHIIKVHTPLANNVCKALQLPTENCVWFENETGGLTAFTHNTSSTRYMAKLDLRASVDLPPTAYYGVFDSPEAWDVHRRRISPMNLYHEPSFPFEEATTLAYDRCRCTLLGVKDAIHKAPTLHPLSRAEMEAMCVPYAEYCFRTKEEADKVGCVTVRVKMPRSPVVFYAAYPNLRCFHHIIHMQRERYLQWPFHLLDEINEPEIKLLAASEDYGITGYKDDGKWNPCGVAYKEYDDDV